MNLGFDLLSTAVIDLLSAEFDEE